MTDDRLRSVTRARVVSREDSVLRAAWIRSSQAPTEAPVSEGVHRGPAPTVVPCGEGAVLVCLGPAPSDALAALMTHARAGARVYALVDGSSPTIDPRLLAGTRVLLRRVPELQHSSVQTPFAARLWIGSGWSIPLDDAQRAGLRRLFLRAFWHDASEEAVLQGDTLAWGPPGARPEEIPEFDGAQALSRLAPGATVSWGPSSTHLYLRAGTVPTSAPPTLFIAPDGAQHDALARLTRAGVSVRWTAQDLPDLALHPDGGELLLRGARRDLRVRLNRAQRDILAKVLDAPCAWRFACNVRIGDVSLRDASLWLPGESAARPLDPEVTLRLGDVRGNSLDDYHLAEPAHLPEPPPRALSVRYEWTARPPSAPKSASEDPLCGRWRTLDARWVARRAALAARHEALVSPRERLAQLPAQDGAVLGFARVHAALGERLRALPGTLSDSGPSSAHAAIAALAGLESECDAQAASLAKAEHAARVAQARQVQEKAWRERRERARSALGVRRRELEDVTARVATLRDALTASPRDGELSEADRDARRRRDTDALQRAEGDARRLREEVQGLARESEVEFSFEPPPLVAPGSASRGAAFVPTPQKAAEALEVPDEALPEVGALRTHKGRRYLVIEERAMLDQARAVAVRLRAELVAPEDA